MVTSFPPHGPGSIPGEVMWDFLVDTVVLGQVFSEYFSSPKFLFQQMFHINIPSSKLYSRASLINNQLLV
jgi:hypothetical protein